MENLFHIKHYGRIVKERHSAFNILIQVCTLLFMKLWPGRTLERAALHKSNTALYTHPSARKKPLNECCSSCVHKGNWQRKLICLLCYTLMFTVVIGFPLAKYFRWHSLPFHYLYGTVFLKSCHRRQQPTRWQIIASNWQMNLVFCRGTITASYDWFKEIQKASR